ncbi:hypothetical protein [Winogradskyella wichelsiae]|uniref:hypothetical protein n=1 Tax=Winogradskyella wichelsiae TaxID=2697007 RepID=UPI003EF60F2A
MKKFLGFIIIVMLTSCRNSAKKQITTETKFEEIIHTNYELNKVSKNAKGVLILFGGFPENAQDIKREFKILKDAKNNAISVLFMNYSGKLWLNQDEKIQLSKQLENIFKTNKLPTDNIFIGGFSSGGNIALLISNFIAGYNPSIKPKGVFIVDAPLDLIGLYNTAQKNIERDFSNYTREESLWILETLSNAFGNPKDSISNYETYAVFTSETKNIDNLSHLKHTKIRLYTEPDTLWWQKTTMAEYKELNAYAIKSLSETLKSSHFKAIQYIPTKNKGYRSNGERHPHSWSIVDTKDLINWMLLKEQP